LKSSPAKLTEPQIEQLLKSGSSKDFEVIYDRFSDALFGVLCRILPDEALAEDVLQEAFVKIWHNAAKYERGKGTIFTWMLNIARNLAIDKLRGKQLINKGKTISLSDTVGMAEASQVGSSTNNAGTERLEEVIELIAFLAPEHKKLIDLVYIQGYTQQEVSELLNVPLGTIKTRIRTALQLLKTNLSANTED